MNSWTVAALLLMVAAMPVCLWAAARGSAVRRLAGLSLSSSVVGAVFLVLPQGYDRSSYQDLALVLAVLSPAGTFVFTRFVNEPDNEPDDEANSGASRDPEDDGRRPTRPESGR